MKSGIVLKTLGINFPEQTLDLLLNLPLPVDGEREDEGEHEEPAEYPGGNLRHPLASLTLLLLVATGWLIQGLEPLGPVKTLVEGVLGKLLVEEAGGVGRLVVVVAVPAETPDLHKIVAAGEYLTAKL